MAHKYLELALTPAVQAAQAHYYGRAPKLPEAGGDDALGSAEKEFIEARDSFYLGSVSASGWPYIQHRGGKRGFLQVLDERTLGFADYRGNRQLLSTGNLSEDARVALFLMDYAARTRLKIQGRARVLDAREHPKELERLAAPDIRRQVERLFLIDVVGFDWNCPQHITPRYDALEVSEIVAPLQERIAELEAQLRER